MEKSALGQAVREKRLQLDLTQDEFARAIGVTKGSIYSLERGVTQSIKEAESRRLLKEKFGIDAASLPESSSPDVSRFEAIAALTGQDLQAVLDAAADAWAKLQHRPDVAGQISPAPLKMADAPPVTDAPPALPETKAARGPRVMGRNRDRGHGGKRPNQTPDKPEGGNG